VSALARILAAALAADVREYPEGPPAAQSCRGVGYIGDSK
jgi:hypothetical protein